jgi:hypothetical protein
MELQFKCPQCNRPIMNRRNKNCLYCGAGLPENLLFTKEEAEMQQRKLDEANRQHRAHQKIYDQETRPGAFVPGII